MLRGTNTLQISPVRDVLRNRAANTAATALIACAVLLGFAQGAQATCDDPLRSQLAQQVAHFKRVGDCALLPGIMALSDRHYAYGASHCQVWHRTNSHAGAERALRAFCRTNSAVAARKQSPSNERSVPSQTAAPVKSAMPKSASCSDITGTKSTAPAVTHCKDANRALHAARVTREKSPAISADEYKKAAAAARRAGDANLELSILREATTAEAARNPAPATPQESMVASREAGTASPAEPALLPLMEIPRMEASKCSDSIRPEIKAIDERIAALEKAEPPFRGGDQVLVGSCASRLAKLYRHGLVFGPGPGLTTVASKAANFEERSCLELKKAYLEKACKCTKQGMSFSTNEAIEDQTLEAYVEIQKLDKKWRDKAIKDPVINKIVTEAAKIRDCFNLQTVEILRDTEKKLERVLAEPAPDSTREAPTQKTPEIPLGRP
jgi:hypothetical protein